MQADQSPSPDTLMNGLASSPLIPPCQVVDTKRDRAISPRDRSAYDLVDHSTHPNPAYNQKTLCPRNIQHTARHLRSCCLFKVAVCRHYLMLSILTRMTYFNALRYQMPASNASPMIIYRCLVDGIRSSMDSIRESTRRSTSASPFSRICSD